MQIAVVDDASPTVDVAALVAEAAPGAGSKYTGSRPTRAWRSNWNQCVRMARGRIVHSCTRTISCATASIDACCRHFPFRRMSAQHSAGCRFIDENDHVTGRTHRERWRAGVLRDWLVKIAEWQRIQCASVLVDAASTRLGGYRGDSTTRWTEMWVRIAARHSTWCEPRDAGVLWRPRQ
jgi:hypothetical protein